MDYNLPGHIFKQKKGVGIIVVKFGHCIAYFFGGEQHNGYVCGCNDAGSRCADF